ncbi:hypothetical protein CSUI_007470 [Cystoisospora suis]|uniref:Uncharacterized protein n=1 Tax=Cystoisospora suis TaxID=483139 RepID=A0A2C6KQ06_9APIC|nr:hypothetical protein CSUI_007470 [Cystoisospora suis]
MHRALVEGNRVCYKRKIELERRQHQERLKAVKPVVKPTPPCQTPRSGRNLKFETLSHERYQEIDRENKLLLDKLCRIMVRPPCTAAVAEPRGPSSLNWKVRRDEEDRIAYNNKFTYKKITEAKPRYSLEEWQRHAAFYARRFRNICEHPAVLGMKDLSKYNKPSSSPGTPRKGNPLVSKPRMQRNFSAYRIPITPRRDRTHTRLESPHADRAAKQKCGSESPRARRAYLHSNDKDYSRSLRDAARSRAQVATPTSPKNQL